MLFCRISQFFPSPVAEYGNTSFFDIEKGHVATNILLCDFWCTYTSRCIPWVELLCHTCNKSTSSTWTDKAKLFSKVMVPTDTPLVYSNFWYSQCPPTFKIIRLKVLSSWGVYLVVVSFCIYLIANKMNMFLLWELLFLPGNPPLCLLPFFLWWCVFNFFF